MCLLTLRNASCSVVFYHLKKNKKPSLKKKRKKEMRGIPGIEPQVQQLSSQPSMSALTTEPYPPWKKSALFVYNGCEKETRHTSFRQKFSPGGPQKSADLRENIFA